MNADLIFGKKNKVTFQSNLTPTHYPFILSWYQSIYFISIAPNPKSQPLPRIFDMTQVLKD